MPYIPLRFIVRSIHSLTRDMGSFIQREIDSIEGQRDLLSDFQGRYRSAIAQSQPLDLQVADTIAEDIKVAINNIDKVQVRTLEQVQYRGPTPDGSHSWAVGIIRTVCRNVTRYHERDGRSYKEIEDALPGDLRRAFEETLAPILPGVHVSVAVTPNAQMPLSGDRPPGWTEGAPGTGREVFFSTLEFHLSFPSIDNREGGE